MVVERYECARALAHESRSNREDVIKVILWRIAYGDSPPAVLPMTIVHPSPRLVDKSSKKAFLLLAKNLDSALIFASRIAGSVDETGTVVVVETEENGAFK
jgi:hypothetical protein